MGSEFFAAAVALTALGLHPFTTYPASLAILARLRPRSVVKEASLRGRVALCVCAYNEERIIRAKAENMLAMRHAVPDLELLIYVDAASDRTVEELSAFSDQIRVIVATERHGKTHGMNTLIEATDADYVVFSDANVMFAPDAVPKLLSPFQDPTVGCVCGHLIYTSADGSGNPTASAGSAYWRLEEAIKELESRTGSTMGADGSIFAIRRELHHRAPPDIIDDMFVSMSILCDRYRVVRAPDALAYEETVSRPNEEFRRKIRIACQAFNVHRHLWPRLRTLSPLDRYKYVSHKLLRWLTVYLLGLAAVFGTIGLGVMGWWTVLSALAVLGVALCGAGLVMTSGPLRKGIEVAMAFVATGVGVLQSLRGKRFQVWTPPASARGGS
jgi:cellulose synthase/poly-beta-1,6-N-acetylglucosamine synthase-like glycosyltransferase